MNFENLLIPMEESDVKTNLCNTIYSITNRLIEVVTDTNNYSEDDGLYLNYILGHCELERILVGKYKDIVRYVRSKMTALVRKSNIAPFIGTQIVDGVIDVYDEFLHNINFYTDIELGDDEKISQLKDQLFDLCQFIPEGKYNEYRVYIRENLNKRSNFENSMSNFSNLNNVERNIAYLQLSRYILIELVLDKFFKVYFNN